jgi:hypothetical protein
MEYNVKVTLQILWTAYLKYNTVMFTAMFTPSEINLISRKIGFNPLIVGYLNLD